MNYLRQTFLDRPYEIDVERLRLATEAYKEHPTAPRKLQCAYAFEKILLHTALYVYDEDLIVDEYMRKQAMHVQFNIMSAETMRAAQEKPEDYKDMLVRVAGYSERQTRTF